MRVSGRIDLCNHELLEGWVVSLDNADERLRLQVFCGPTVIGECTADRFRQDLEDAGMGDGRCAFSFAMPASLPQHALPSVRLRVLGTDLFLMQASSLEVSDAGHPAQTRSAFGGLWIDRSDWLDRLAQKTRLGELTEAMSHDIFRFVRDGYLIVPNAVPADVLDVLNDEIELFWHDPPDGMLAETEGPSGVLSNCSPDISLRSGKTQLLDVFAFSDTARQATAAPAVIEFLKAIFEDTPKAFRGATQWKGLEGEMHKDTADVRVDTNPLALVTTWLALEDVKPGSGELEFLVGSHRAPDYLFGGTSKWMLGAAGERERYVQTLLDDAAMFQQARSSFVAAKGDVLIGHADLAHCGAAVTHRKATRKTMKTHFTSATDKPYYHRVSQREAVSGSGCMFVSEYANVSG